MGGSLSKAKMAMGALIASFLTFSLVLYPGQALHAAVEGMDLFWKIVFPSLLPFFVLSEILLGLGVVHFIGVLLEPLMRPVFNVPGIGAFALSMGLAAGYPMDAVITNKFRRKGLCSRIEGERLLAFTNTADPLFIFGAVAVGMFGLPQMGMILAIAHYLSSFTVGFIFRFHGRREKGAEIPAEPEDGGLFRRAGRALIRARREDGRTFGRLLGEAVKESIGTLLMICGFIMLFSVIVRIFIALGLMQWVSPPVAGLLRMCGLSPSLVDAVLRGVLEIDLGTVAASKAAAPLLHKAVMASAIIAWSGLSVHGQVASVVNGSDIRMRPYVVARLCHAVIAGLYTAALFVFIPVETMAGLGSWPPFAWMAGSLAQRFILAGWQILICLGFLLCGALVTYIGRRYRLLWVGFKAKRP